MTPYYNEDGITIYCGDCLEVMPKLEPVDLIVTDPAYKVISGGSGKPGDGSPSGILSKNDGKIFEHNDIFPVDYAPLFFDVLKDPAHCYVMINDLNLEKALGAFREAGFGFHRTLVWKKNNVTPGRWYMKDYEMILFFRKGAAFPINNASARSTLTYPNPRHKLHPTEKPEMLMREMIQNSSQAGDVVLDPFMGSGSTLEAAYKSGRRAIGIEIDEKYCKIAVDRLKRVPNFFNFQFPNNSPLTYLEW